MLRTALLVAACLGLALAVPLSQAPTRSMVRLTISSPEIMGLLHENDLWTEGGLKVGREVDAVVPFGTLARLAALNTNMTVMIPDVDGLIEEQNLAFEARANAADYNANYHTVEEITERLQYFANNYKNVDFIENIGTSLEGRKVPALRFGRKAQSANDKVPTVWVESNIHAREWITGATTMYILQKLLEGSETEYKDIFEGLQFYFAPVINPDGFTYSQKKDRLWRKNRRDNGDGSFGVDLNRNWGDHWGGEGASTDPSDETYRGPKAFSEPETANIVAYLQKLESEGNVIESAWDVHSYSQLILRPYGWVVPSKAKPANDAEIKALGEELRKIVKSVHGTDFENIAASSLYPASGGADDWFGVHTAQEKAFTFELRDTGRYGFLLPANQIIPSGEEILPAFVYFARDTLQTALRRRASSA